MFENEKKDFMKEIAYISANGHNFTEIFNDFIQLFAIEIESTYSTKSNNEEYQRIVKKYSVKEFNHLTNMAGIMGCALNSQIGDFIGEVFMQQSMNDKKFKAQVFTPFNIAESMCKMIDEEKTKKILENKPVLLAHDPCVGAGVFPIAYAKHFEDMGYNYAEQLLFVCYELDPVCVDMAYVQLSLLGIPARIYQGNTLTLQFTRCLDTPALIFNWMHFKKYLDTQKTEEAITKPEQLSMF